jgi:radical SAM superfamily enzyme YgiQ (UPF0313 family)
MDAFYGTFGLRSISSCLKQRGHVVQMFFLLPIERFDYSGHFSVEILQQLAELVADSDVIGISCMSNEAEETIRVVDYLKKLNKPIVWGGIHATSCPDQCIAYADIVCIGEGEEAFCELVETMERRQSYFDTKNFWFNNQGDIIKNPTRPLIEDLDSLPFPDHQPDSHYVLEAGKIIKATEWYKRVDRLYIHTARGCPNSCNFCCNSFIRDIYAGKGKVIRKMSVDSIIGGIKQFRNNFPKINFVWFTDDTMFAKSKQEIMQFAKEYKEKINLPFWCYVSPNSITEEKLDMLVSAGLCKIEMGIQSGSENINKNLYNRQISNDVVVNAANIISKRKDKIVCANYQIIICNPYETRKDILDTISLISSLPAPFRLQAFPLQFFPASGLYDKAKEDGLLEENVLVNYQDFEKGIELNRKESYLNYLLFMMKGNVTPDRIGLIPRFLLPILISKIAISCFSNKLLLNLLIKKSSKFIDNRTGEISFPDLKLIDI